MAPETTFSDWLSEEEKQAIEQESRSCFTSVIFVNCFHFFYLSSYNHFSAFYFPSQYKPNFPSTVAQYFLRWCLGQYMKNTFFTPLSFSYLALHNNKSRPSPRAA